ncbi:hypothetical protein Cadr_000027151 [Camelus dromedarius]|uniref:Uncharacterized protein n=1 Tax=Camelus dromedarius TaxID=9838 RepID=A0A5N4C5B7_CAMDR|nr:hypothetical protein Cadr_000027151 [Camelus dromedarius]
MQESQHPLQFPRLPQGSWVQYGRSEGVRCCQSRSPHQEQCCPVRLIRLRPWEPGRQLNFLALLLFQALCAQTCSRGEGGFTDKAARTWRTFSDFTLVASLLLQLPQGGCFRALVAFEETCNRGGCEAGLRPGTHRLRSQREASSWERGCAHGTDRGSDLLQGSKRQRNTPRQIDTDCSEHPSNRGSAQHGPPAWVSGLGVAQALDRPCDYSPGSPWLFPFPHVSRGWGHLPCLSPSGPEKNGKEGTQGEGTCRNDPLSEGVSRGAAWEDSSALLSPTALEKQERLTYSPAGNSRHYVDLCALGLPFRKRLRKGHLAPFTFPAGRHSGCGRYSEPRTVDFREGRHVSDSRERKKGVHVRHQSPDGKRVLKRLYMEEPSHFFTFQPSFRCCLLRSVLRTKTAGPSRALGRREAKRSISPVVKLKAPLDGVRTAASPLAYQPSPRPRPPGDCVLVCRTREGPVFEGSWRPSVWTDGEEATQGGVRETSEHTPSH